MSNSIIYAVETVKCSGTIQYIEIDRDSLHLSFLDRKIFHINTHCILPDLLSDSKKPCIITSFDITAIKYECTNEWEGGDDIEFEAYFDDKYHKARIKSLFMNKRLNKICDQNTRKISQTYHHFEPIDSSKSKENIDKIIFIPIPSF